jgi:hypothetical protein
MKNNKMPPEDFIILLGMLDALNAEGMGVDKYHNVIKAEPAERDGRLKIISDIKEE